MLFLKKELDQNAQRKKDNETNILISLFSIIIEGREVKNLVIEKLFFHLRLLEKISFQW